jgi:hypothetical protein
VYLLLDMQQAMVTVFDDPAPDRGSRLRSQVRFGESLHIPEPFDFRFDTSGWEN